ncbi:SDR family oxidoreductase [Alphaproteobacteria bacterium]|nr:SDR family oxidoreductase [Alphaproteobacteria bacterium]
MNSKKKIALITGAESGIGKSTSKIFLNNNFRVIGTSLKKNKYKYIKDFDNYQIDITNNTEWRDLASIIRKKYSKIDVLVNSAGVRLSGNLETTSMNDWSYHFNNNVTGTFLACKYTLPLLKKSNKSSIINLASINSIRGVKNMLAYATSKSAIVSFTASLALDLSKHNIRVNAVAPGAIDTPMLASFKKDLTSKEYQKRMRDNHPIGRIGKPEEVASVIYFLASEASSFMTGLTIPVDGGRSIR